MSLVDITKAVARNIGIEPYDAVIGDPEAAKVLQFINETGEELARRVDWSALRKAHGITGTGANDAFSLPSDLARLTQGLAVTADGSPVRGSLTADEWNALTHKEDTPRYYYFLGSSIRFYPYPPLDLPVVVTYQSKNWVSGDKAAFEADADTALVPDRLLEMGAVWRFKRSIEADYADYMAEYEAALKALSSFDDRARIP